MKTVLASILAGVIGAGATVGGVAMGLVPIESPRSNAVARVGVPENLEIAPERDASLMVQRLESEVSSLSRQVNTINSVNQQLEHDLYELNERHREDVGRLGREIEQLRDATPVMVSGEGGEGVPRAVVRTAVESELDRRDAQRREDERVVAQERRIERLQRSHQMAEQFVPRYVETRAESLNIAETLVPDVSNIMVQHAKRRAEIRSERESQRIDGIEVNEDSFTARFEDLDRQTSISLSGLIGNESAQTLLSGYNRMSDGGARFRGPGGGGFGGRDRDGDRNRRDR